jgi:hypothetical protein
MTVFKTNEIVLSPKFESQQIRLINCSYEYRAGQVKVAFNIYLHVIIGIINNEPSPGRIRRRWWRYKVRRDPAASARYRD